MLAQGHLTLLLLCVILLCARTLLRGSLKKRQYRSQCLSWVAILWNSIDKFEIIDISFGEKNMI